MYSLDERKKAIKTLKKNNWKITKTARELGMKNRSTLKRWVQKYKNGKLLDRTIKKRKPVYSMEEIKKAVEFYYEHGEVQALTRRVLGYPSRPVLTDWLEKYGHYKKKKGSYNPPLKKCVKNTVIESFCDGQKISQISKNQKISRTSIYKIIKDKESKMSEIRSKVSMLDKNSQEYKELIKTIKNKQINLDVYRFSIPYLRANDCNDLINLPNKVKAEVIEKLKEDYSYTMLIQIFNISRTTFYYNKKLLNFDKYESLRIEVIKTFNDNYKAYGYRRIHSDLKMRGIIKSEKVIRKIMNEEKLFPKRKKKHKSYSSYKGEISEAPDNLVKRQFHASEPNKLWLTDITEFSLRESKVYLSPIIDCYNQKPITWKIGTSPNAVLANSTLLDAISKINNRNTPIIHSDRGFHYRLPDWIDITKANGITRSMSKKGCSADNSACEGFFGLIKQEFFYNRFWYDTPVEVFIKELNNYLNWFITKRISNARVGRS